MSYRFVFLALILVSMAGCEHHGDSAPASLKPETVLASCQKAVADKDTKTAASECQFAEQWLARVQPDSLPLAEAQEQLADFMTLVNANAAANGYYQQALTLLEKRAVNPVAVARLQLKLANNLSGLGKWAPAEIAYKNALRQIETRKGGAESPEAAEVLNRLGVVQLQQQLLADAEQSLRRALTIREAKYTATDTTLAETYNNLGFMYQAMGKNQDAESFYRKAMLNQESAQNIPYPALYDSLSNLAMLLQTEGKFQAAEPYWQKQLQVADKGFGKESVQYSNSLNSLALLAMAVRNFAAAEKLFNEALAIREKILGVNHIQTAEAANNLAVALANQGKRAQAEPLMRHAAAVTQVALGANNPLTQQRWNSLLNLEGGVAKNPVPAVKPVDGQAPEATPEAPTTPDSRKTHKK